MNYEDFAVRFPSLDWDSPQDHVRVKERVLGKRRLRIVEWTRGMQHPDWCTAGHVGYVLEGRCAIEFEGGTVELAAGDGLVIPDGAQTRHRPIPISERVVLILSEITDP